MVCFAYICDNMVKVSVLVAIYNAGEDLRRCLDSLCRQTLKECEFLCIDDCSTDKSAEIVREYVEKDGRFRLFGTEVNSGQAVARNLGLSHARGEYVTMLDADDWLSDDALQKACEAIEGEKDCDCALLRLYTDGDEIWKEFELPERRTYTGQEAFRLSLNWTLHGYYLIRREIHLRYPYDTSCRVYSDDNTTRLHFLHSRLVVISDGIYYYRQHANSITHKVSVQKFLFMDAFSSMKEQILREIAEGNVEDADAVMTEFENLRWINFLSMMRYYFEYEKQWTSDERKDILGRLRVKLQTFERNRIRLRFKVRFGYIPIKNWYAFYWQMKIFAWVYPIYRIVCK